MLRGSSDMREIRKCKIHGDIEFRYSKSENRWRCVKCSSESVAKRRKELMRKAREYLGGKCSICGYDKCYAALEFHHICGDDKEFGVSSRGTTRSWDKIKNEISKCALVCSNCHRELHNPSS